MIGDDIRRKREQLGFSQEEVARAIKTTQQTIQRIETNKSPRSSYIEPLLQHLGLKVDSAPENESQRDKISRSILIKNEKKFFYPANWSELTDFIQFRRTDKERERGPSELVPVFGMGVDPVFGSMINKNAVEFLDRPEPLSYSIDAYAIKIAIDDMYPALKVSEIALVNPDLSPFKDEPHLFIGIQTGRTELNATVAYLDSFTADTWEIKKFSPFAHETLNRSVYPTCHRIVGKFSRR